MIEVEYVFKHTLSLHRGTFGVKFNRFYIAVYRSSKVTFAPMLIALVIIITTVHP